MKIQRYMHVVKEDFGEVFDVGCCELKKRITGREGVISYDVKVDTRGIAKYMDNI